MTYKQKYLRVWDHCSALIETIRFKPLTGFCMEGISMKKVNVTHKQEKSLTWSKHWLTSNFLCWTLSSLCCKVNFGTLCFSARALTDVQTAMLCQCIVYCNFSVCFLWLRPASSRHFYSQVDSLELPETPKITELTESFKKVTKHLTKFKETLINYVWEKSHVKKQYE